VAGQKLFNPDLIDVIGRSDRPLRAVVDNHYLSFYILQKVRGVQKVLRVENARYDAWRRLMVVFEVAFPRNGG